MILTIDYTDNYEINPMGGIKSRDISMETRKKIYGEFMIKSNDKSYLYVDAKEKPECEDKVCEY